MRKLIKTGIDPSVAWSPFEIVYLIMSITSQAVSYPIEKHKKEKLDLFNEKKSEMENLPHSNVAEEKKKFMNDECEEILESIKEIGEFI